MPTADKVIIELEARIGKAEADIRKYKDSTAKAMDKIAKESERAARKQEAAFKRASRAIQADQAQIGASMKSLAASIGAYFTGSELIQLADGFTRVTNSLKVAGLEGAALKGVQDQLLAQSQKYGVGLEELAKLYGNVSQSAKELGATSSDIIGLTEYTAQALKISGTSATQAQGAILGLNQALASGRVSIEEFNQMNEGGLRPLLQAAANSEKFGGSISKLREYMKEAGISGAEMYRMIVAGSGDLGSKAAKANLTLAGGFEALTSSIMVYMGEADQANGVSAALGQAMITLSENLDVLSDAIAAISVAVGVKMVAGAAAGSGALRAISAYASIATTSLEGTALAARGLGAALLTAMGGPVGAVITATALAIGYLATKETEAEKTAERLAEAQKIATQGRNNAIDISRRYAAALGAERAEVAKLIQAEIKLANTRLVAAKSEQATAMAKLARDKQTLAIARQAAQRGGGKYGAGGLMAASNLESANSTTQKSIKNLNAATENVNALSGMLNELAHALKGGGPIGSGGGFSPVSGDDKKKEKKSQAKRDTGPSDSEIEADHASELRRLNAEELQARIQLTDDIHEKAELQKELDKLEYQDRLAQIKQNKDFTQAQKEEQIKALQRIFGTGQEGTAQEGLRRSMALKELDREIARQEDELNRAILDAKEADLDLILEGTLNRRDQYEIEKRILQLRHDAELAAIDNSDLDEKIKEQKRKQLESETKANEERLKKSKESPLEQYRRDSEEIAANLGDAFEGVAVNGINALNDGIVDAIMGAKSLGDMFKNVAKQIIADLLRIAVRMAIFNAIGKIGIKIPGMGGGIGGGLPGNSAGGAFRVKGAGGTDNNVLSLNGQPMRRVSMGETVSISPSGRGGMMGGGPSIYVDARGAVMNDQFAQMILSQSKQYAAEAGAAAYGKSMRDAPGAVSARQKYG